MTFAEQLKHYRGLSGKTQGNVATEANTTVSQVCSIERGKWCNLRTAFALARAVGMKTIIVPDDKGE